MLTMLVLRTGKPKPRSSSPSREEELDRADYLPRDFCASALPAADLVAFELRPSERALDAAVAALGEVSLPGDLRCASALPAADFDLAAVDLLDSVFDALLAAGFEVTFLVAICMPPEVFVIEGSMCGNSAIQD
ncbi:MAG: hypothetical protein ABIP49_06355 [Lysobacterales bacterium]